MPPEMNDQKIRIKLNNKLPDIDKVFVTISYPFFVPHDLTIHVESTLSVSSKTSPVKMISLKMPGYVSDTRNTILNYWSQRDWRQIRYAFTDCCTSTRIVRKPAQGVNPNAEEILPDGFKDGCLHGVIDREIRHLNSEGNGVA